MQTIHNQPQSGIRLPADLRSYLEPFDPSPDSKLPPGRVAGVDFGTKRMGIAISDPGQTIASPLVGYERLDQQQDARWFVELVKREEITAWVVGLPVYPSGDESPKSREARAFGEWLRELTSLPVVFFDERYSTAQADTFMAEGQLTRKRKKDRRDMLAAQVILAAYLESKNRGGPPEPLDDSSPA